MTIRVSRWAVLGTALALLLSADLFAQNPPPPAIESVYSTNSSNDSILKLDFDTGTSTVVNTDATQRVRIEGIAVRNDVATQHLLVCDRGSGEVLFYENATGAGQVITSAIRLPHSVSLDQSGNAYVVSAIKREVWKLPIGGTGPGGYGNPVLIDTITSSTLIKEAKLVAFSAGGLQSGGLVVLSRVPALVYFYPPDPLSPTGFGPRQVLVPTSAFNGGAQPTGFAFAPNQELLIAVQQGKVLRYSPAGQRVLPNFASGIGKGLVKIAVGVQGGLSRAFVADPKAGGKLHRLLINNDGTGTIDAGVKSGVSVPGGVNTASAGGAPTPVGNNVEVSPAPPVELTFDNVVAPGLTTSEIVEFVDNRGPQNGGNYYVAQNLKDFFSPNDPLYNQLPNVTIPANVQAFKKGDPNTGVPTFLMAILDTTATFGRTVEFHYDEAEQLGYEPSCVDADITQRPRTFYAPEIDPPKSEPGIVEGNVFVNFSSGCGSNIGRGGRFSLWLTARETDPPADTADSQLSNMTAAMDFYPCIDADLRAALDAELLSAVAAFADYKQSGDPDDQAAAIAHLDAYVALVDASPGGFAGCAANVNVGGELIARAQAARFSIGQVVVTPPPGGGALLIVHTDYAGSAPAVELMATGKFSQVDEFDAYSGTPSLALLQQYVLVLAYTNFTPNDPTGLGDVLADYVDSGGGLALATYSFSTPWAIAGRITTSGYSPLLDSGFNADVSGVLNAEVPTDPVFDGVNLGTLSYFHNSNFSHPNLAAGATLVATDGAEVNMIARSGSTSMIGLNLFPGNIAGGNNSDFYLLLANAIVSTQPE